MNDEIWSKQFYKALEAVGKLTEVEKSRLADILLATSGVKKEVDSPKREIPPPPPPPENRKQAGWI